MTPDRIRKRYIIATGLVIGLKVVEIARQIGVSRIVGESRGQLARGAVSGKRSFSGLTAGVVHALSLNRACG
jgi:hypothetical protein